MHLVKLKNNNYGQIPATPEGGCKLMVGAADSPTNPNKGHTENRNINIQTVWVRVDRQWKMHECMALEKPHRVVKINLSRIIYKTLKYIYLEL